MNEKSINIGDGYTSNWYMVDTLKVWILAYKSQTFASAYNSEIIKDLNLIYDYKGKIIYIEDDKICTINW